MPGPVMLHCLRQRPEKLGGITYNPGFGAIKSSSMGNPELRGSWRPDQSEAKES